MILLGLLLFLFGVIFVHDQIIADLPHGLLQLEQGHTCRVIFDMKLIGGEIDRCSGHTFDRTHSVFDIRCAHGTAHFQHRNIFLDDFHFFALVRLSVSCSQPHYALPEVHP